MAAAPPTRTRRRRTQEERSAATRARVVAAARQCVAELGFRGATMSAIAQQAGLSWGALQHQFGEKDAIFDAVLDQSVADLRDGLEALGVRRSTPRARVRALCRHFERLHDGTTYRVFVEIQLARSRRNDATTSEWSRYVAQTLSEVWQDLFAEAAVPRRQLDDAQRFAFAVLSGAASESMLFAGSGSGKRQFEILEEALARLLGVE